MEASPDGLAKDAGWKQESADPKSKWVHPDKPGKKYANAQELVEGEGLAVPK